MWELVISGPGLPAVRRALSPNQTLVIGRSEGSDVPLTAPSISRRHAQFAAGNDTVRVRDLGSRNGTTVNGAPVGTLSRPIQPGDLVKVGDYAVKLVRAGGTQPEAPPARDGFVTLRSSPQEANPLLTYLQRPRDCAEVDPQYAPLLFELAAKETSSEALGTFLGEVLDYALAVTGYEGQVLLRGADGEFAPRPGADGLPFSRTIVDAAVARRSAVLVNHLPSDPRFYARESVVLSGHLRVLCAPFFGDSGASGALYLSTRTAEPPTQKAVDFVGAIAQLAATALDKDRRRSFGSVARKRAAGAAQSAREALQTIEATEVAFEGVHELLAAARASVERLEHAMRQRRTLSDQPTQVAFQTESKAG